MPALLSDLRKTLEATVVKARDKAEGGARDALTALAVGASEPFASMSEEERKLRNRLRARGRQLGDQRDPQKGSQSIERLVREMAYEHWHRMLFARFLAENQLLIEPSSGVSISLDECEELAAEEGTDLWGLAAQFAQEMLPQIFRGDDPVLAAKLPLEIRQQLQGLVAELETETFTASDSLGWTYQFWQTKRKKEVNDSGVKIGADELSPVTQLFTEDYMVDFLLDNTLGAWHAGNVLSANPQLASTAHSEDNLRKAVALPGCPWSYLRFVKTDDGAWTPAAGTFNAWPRTAAELKCLDPCMGSGHFVVAIFERLVALRLAEEDQREAAAVAAVIEGNLFGLEIDPRCTQIAAFNLALAAWRRMGHCKLPAMNLACSGLSPNTQEAEWLAMAGENERLRNGMERLYGLFQKASVLGSLINPRAGEGDLLIAAFHELQPLLEQALAQESQDDTSYEMAVTARGLAKAAEVLAGQFSLVATNVPYLARGKQDDILRDHTELHHNEGKADLATAFVSRSLSMCSPGGSVALVTPQNWLFLKTYSRLREKLLVDQKWNIVARLGTNAFQDMNWWAATTALVVLSHERAKHWFMSGIDVSSDKSQEVKAGRLANRISTRVDVADQSTQLQNPDARIGFGERSSHALLEAYAVSRGGITTGDSPRFRRAFWEISENGQRWCWQQGTFDTTKEYSGRELLLDWSNESGEIALSASTGEATIAGRDCWSRRGIAVRYMNHLPATLYTGEIFENVIAVIVPSDPAHVLPIWCFCSDQLFFDSVREIDQKTAVTCNTLAKVPFDLAHWQKVADEKYPEGLPQPYSSDPAQWLFNGHPFGADKSLHVALARLLGYQWPRQTGSSFPECPALGPDGLEPLADDDGIVCLSPIRGEAAAADRLRGMLSAAFGEEWSKAKERELLLETAVAHNTKASAADLGDWLRQSFFAEHCKLFRSRPFIWQIWDGTPHGFSALVNYHKLAAPNGQGRKTLEKLTFTYLRDWIDRQKQDQVEGINGADDRYTAAIDLQGQLEKILDGEPPYDLFVRWKPIHQQAIGWDPDINDGVRLNIRPFLNARLRKGGIAGAGILRAKPGTIKWAKDRGNEPIRSKEEFPWFWGWDENDQEMNPSDPTKCANFGAPTDITGDQGQKPRYQPVPAGDSFDGNRWNDLHYSRAAKEAARASHRGEG
jgi:hypothetical protein